MTKSRKNPKIQKIIGPAKDQSPTGRSGSNQAREWRGAENLISALGLATLLSTVLWQGAHAVSYITVIATTVLFGLVFLIFRFTTSNPRVRGLLGWAIATSFLGAATVTLLAYNDNRYLAALVEDSFRPSPEEVSKALLPLPIRIDADTLIQGRYLEQSIASRSNQVIYTVGPAGVGKSLFAKMLMREFLEQETTNFAGAVLLELNALSDGNMDRNGAYGTMKGLPKVPSLESGQDSYVTDWIADLVTKEVHDSLMSGVRDDLSGFVLGKNRRAEVLEAKVNQKTRRWLAQARKAGDGLVIVIDDLDEIDQTSFKELIRLVDNDADRSSELGRLTVFLMGRTEILLLGRRFISRQFTSWEFLPMSIQADGFDVYLDDCIQFPYEEDRAPSGLESTAVAALILGAIQKEPDGTVAQAVSYLEAANWTTSYFLRKIRRNSSYTLEQFDDGEFKKEFFSFWWTRAVTTHDVPEEATGGRYPADLGEAVHELGEPWGEQIINDQLRLLLLSGFAHLEPIDIGAFEYKIRLQFPFTYQILVAKGAERNNAAQPSVSTRSSSGASASAVR